MFLILIDAYLIICIKLTTRITIKVISTSRCIGTSIVFAHTIKWTVCLTRSMSARRAAAILIRITIVAIGAVAITTIVAIGTIVRATIFAIFSLAV